jgi:hypothetical protein
MNTIFGAEIMEEFKLKRPAGYVDLMIAFEARKRTASPFKNNPLNISLPFSFIDFYKKKKVECFSFFHDACPCKEFFPIFCLQCFHFVSLFSLAHSFREMIKKIRNHKTRLYP